RLPRRVGGPSQQRPTPAPPPPGRGPDYRHDGRDLPSKPARRLTRARRRRPWRPYHRPRTHALASSRPQRMESRTLSHLGRRDRPQHARFRPRLARIVEAPRTLLSLLPRPTLSSQALQVGTARSRLSSRLGHRRSTAIECPHNPRTWARFAAFAGA